MCSIFRDCRLLSALVLLSAALPATDGLADCPDTTVDAKAVRSLLTTADAASLDSRFAQLRTDDPAIIATYRRRRLQLDPTKQEEVRYLQSLPATREELSRVYTLVDSRDLCGDRIVSDIVDGMWARAARLVRKHGVGHEAFIRRCLLTDGYVAEDAWDVFDWLLKHDTMRTVAAIRKLSSEDQKRVCGDADLQHISAAEARKRCASGL
jgi:hypothetical protein